MADFASVAAVSSSLVRFISHSFDQDQPIPSSGVSNTDTSVALVRTEDLSIEDNPLMAPPSLAIFLYRVDINSTTRASLSRRSIYDGQAQLPLEFHYLMIPFGSTAEQEYRILGRTLQCLEDTPILTGPLLDPVTDWKPNDSVQIVAEDLSTEDLMRIFDSLPVDYKLCLPYMAKVLVMQGQRTESLREVGRVEKALVPRVNSK